MKREVKASQHSVAPNAFPVMPTDIHGKYRDKSERKFQRQFREWHMVTAVGGGPCACSKRRPLSSPIMKKGNFAGKARYDKHPRTAMGYTKDGKIIILVVQGRFPGIAEGVDFKQEAIILKDLGCYEALNLDGGGSSCMLINGKETIKPCDKEGQRAVPAVFMIKRKLVV